MFLMAKGKTTCRILKEIRRQIAEANDIEYVVEECQYKGDCKGTCPKCEAEVKYLENQLHKRQMLGKAVVVAGLSLGVIPAMAQNIQNTDDVVTKSSICLSDTVINAKNIPSGKYIIRGKVVDRNNSAIDWATIQYDDKEKGSKTILSEDDGVFAIGVSQLPIKLKVIYTGYIDIEFEVTEKNYNKFFQVTLANDPDAFKDVIGATGADGW